MEEPKPPKIASGLLKWFISEAIFDEVHGDLLELYRARLDSKGLLIASLYFYKDVVLSLRNVPLRRNYRTQNSTAMFKNYFKIAYRNILKHKFYTLANTISLSIGLASVMLITLFVQQELSYDNFHENGPRIYRLNKLVDRDGKITKNAESSGLFGPSLAEEFPEVSEVVRVSQRSRTTLNYKETNFKVNGALYVDDNFFEVFDFELKRGNPEEVLKLPMSVVLTERVATALFKNEDPIGKSIVGIRGLNYTVTGIAANCPKNSHIQFEMLTSWISTVPDRGPLSIGWMNNWYTQGLATYLMLEPSASPASVDSKLPAFEEKNIPERAEMYDFYLQPFEQVYLGSADVQFSPAMSGTKFLYILSSIALAILLIAVFNYVNISTSKAASRAKEIGIRKVVGALKRQIVIQHLLESFILVFLASLIGAFLVKTALPFFNEFTGRNILLTDISSSLVILTLIIILLIAVASGIYPAMIMSGFKPVQVLKGSISGKSFGNGPRQVLITFQFVITIVMIVCTIFISRQTAFMNNKNLGYEKENVLMTQFSDAIYYNHEPFINELVKDNSITDYALSQQTPKWSNASNSYYPDGIREKEVEARTFSIDDRFLKFYQMEIVQGRGFDRNISSDLTTAVINETMMEKLGWDQPIGRQLGQGGDDPALTIIGVVKDFNFRSLHREVEPIVMEMTSRPYSLALKTRPDNVKEVIGALERTWEKFENREPLVYSFLEEDLKARYDSENNVFKAISIFAVISILISCFGLYGLTSYTVQQKIKEVGIRKVLGAKESAVIYLINRRFGITLLIALLIAIPVSYTMMNAWLQGFAYRIDLGMSPFALAILITALITSLTISFQTIKAARANPVKALRTE